MTELFHYSLGKRLLAADCELPFLERAEAIRAPDISLRLAARAAEPPALQPWHRGELSIDKADGGELVLRFTDGTSFLVDAHSIALIAAPPGYTTGDLAAYALGPVAAIVLHLQGAVLLHAAAVVIAGKAVLIAGAPRSGKSTTAALLHKLGYAVLSDDVTEIEGTRALPSANTIRLWPDALDALFGSAAAFPDRAPSWDKKIMAIGNAARDAHEIGAILFLDAERRETPRLERLAPAAGWQRLMAEAYTVRLPDPRMERAIFEATSLLADRVPMFAFAPPPLAHSATLGAFLERALR